MNVLRSTRSFWIIAVIVAIASSASFGQLVFSVGFGPPALPVYEQPPLPAPGYMWVPGYWAYGPGGYFWVPGTWVMAPQPGLLWTPGYWGWGNGAYLWHEGYWGPRVGYYGGVPYGYGYTGAGYQGGYWQHGAYYYNSSVNNVSTTNVTNVYHTTVINNTTVNNVSYNGGEGGITARPTPEEESYANERHVAPTAVQTQHIQAASTNRQLLASENHGVPVVAATAKAGEFRGAHVVAAKAAGAPYKAPATQPAVAHPAVQPTPRPGVVTSPAVSTANPKVPPQPMTTTVSQPHPQTTVTHPAPVQHPVVVPKANTPPAKAPAKVDKEHPH